MTAPQPLPRPSILREAAIIAGVTLAIYWLCVHLELSEKLTLWTQGYEHLQLDEMPLALLFLSIGLAGFGWRRRRELMVEIQARTQAEEANLRILAENRQLAQQLILLQEQERRHLARELHDELGQCCVAITVDAAAIAQDTREQLPSAHASAQAIGATAKHLQHVIRGLLTQLRPTGLDELGLVACLELLVESWSQVHGIACRFAADALPDGLDEATNISIYRTVQESLTNIARHAHATQASVTLCGPATAAGTGACIELAIDDNGSGIASDSMRNGFGLLGMRERIHALGGSVVFQARPAGGTRIVAVLPWSGESAAPP